MLENLPSYPIVIHPGQFKFLIPTTPLEKILGCFPKLLKQQSTFIPFNPQT